MGGIDLKLTIGGESVTSFSNPVTVTTYVAKGLSNVKVKYNGTGEQPTFVSYDSASGKLVFTTTHFSEFYVTSDSVAYIPETNTAYSSLKEAIDAVREGETVKLIRDAKESCITIGENKEVLLDLNGNTYTLNSVQDSSEIKSSIKISSGSSVKIIGTGLIKVQNDDSSITDVMLPSGARNKNYIIYVGNNSSLTIEDDVVIGGLLDSPSSRAIYVDKNASLNINGGLIRTFSANGGSTIYNDGNAFINGGTILSGCFAIGSDAGNLTITDGVMASVASNLFEDANNKSYYAYAVRCGGTFEMTGGDVYGVQGGISATNGTATFSGTAHGETTYEIFDKIRQASDDETADAYMEYYKANARKSEATIGASELYYGMYVAGEHGKVEPVKIYGGTYISGSKVAMLVGNSQDGGLGEFAGVSVYGGTFKGINGAVKVDGGSEADGYGKGSLKLYGGRYSSTANMENCLAEGYAVSVNPDIEGFYEVFEIGFAGGNGTEDNPYLISDVAQFMILDNDNIELSGKYLKLNNDISIPADTFITNTVDYYLDGNGHKIELTGTAPSDLTTYSTFSIFETLGNGSFSNIDFHTKGFKALSQSLSEDCSFTFSAVDVYGDMSGGDSNVGAYVVFVGANSSLKFDGCDSYVNITDNQGGSHYGAPFVGGYLMYNSSKPVGERTPKSVEFTDCNNHGDVFFGKWAALLIGNPSNYDKFVGEGKSINYSNCHNYGTISAIEKVGIVTCNDTTSFDSVNAGDGSFIVFDDSEYIKSFIVSSSDGTVRLETENIPEDATIEYGVVVYCSYPEGVTGTRRITFTIDISDYNNKLPVKAFYDADGSYYNGEVVETDGVYLIYCNPDSYEMGPNGNVSSKVDYCVIIKSDNKIIASKYAELS